jgi:phosphoribosylformylglycinamidine synthase
MRVRRNEKGAQRKGIWDTRSKICSPQFTASRNMCAWQWVPIRFLMKAKIIITPKRAVLDPQGKTVQNALTQMGYAGVGAVHVGKYLEIELDGADKEAARKQIDDACHKILSNPVIEEYRFEVE